jgi:hypothetical protein
LDTRHARRVPLDIYVNKVIDGVPHLARSRNISRGGMYLHRLLEPAVEGARLAVELTLPGSDDVLWLEAEVAHDAFGGTGLRFLDLAPRDQAVIDAFISAAG